MVHWEDFPVYNEEEDTDGDYSKVYIILEEPDPRAKTWRLKVGKSGSVKKRLQDLQSGNSRKLLEVQKFDVYDAKEAEKAAHKVAKHKYEHISGEWFRIKKDEFTNFIEDIKQAVSQY